MGIRSAVPTRQAIDLGADYVLRSLGLLSEVFDGDILRGAIFLAVLQASSQHFRQEHAHREGACIDDAARRPTTLSAIARSLGLSVETTRRHVMRLSEDGFVSRTAGGGVIVFAANLEHATLRRAARANCANLATVHEGLSRMASVEAGPGCRSDAASARGAGSECCG